MNRINSFIIFSCWLLLLVFISHEIILKLIIKTTSPKYTFFLQLFIERSNPKSEQYDKAVIFLTTNEVFHGALDILILLNIDLNGITSWQIFC